MRLKSLLTVLGLMALVLLGFQALSPSSRAYSIDATVDIKPETLNINRQGKWITVHIRLEGYNVSDIDTSSILLQDLFAPEWTNIEGDSLMVKFDASSVIEYASDRLYHMGAIRGSIELRVAGQLMDGTHFSGIDEITIMNPVGK